MLQEQLTVQWWTGSLLVAKEEMVEEDRDLELGEIVARAQPRAEPERKERSGPRRRALRIRRKENKHFKL